MPEQPKVAGISNNRGARPGERRGGRQKGTPNRKTREVQEILASVRCDPIRGMAKIAAGDVPCAVCLGKGKTKYQPARGKDKLLDRTCQSCYGRGKEIISPDLKLKAFAELAQYEYPKRKAIEVSGTVELNVNVEQRLAGGRARLAQAS